MFRDEFKSRYTTIPFAICRENSKGKAKEVISHQHREIELISMTSGKADFYIDTKHYRLEAGDVLIIPPFSIHRIEASAGEPVLYNCICFDLSLLWDEEIKTGLINHTLFISAPIGREEPYAARLREWIEDGCCACERKYVGWELEAVGEMSMIFGTLKKNGLFSSDINDEARSDFAERALGYIAANYSEPITSASAAEYLYMNNSYFCRIFKRSFGCCFSNYVLAYRLEKAKMYLRNTEDKVTEISFKLGFNGCSYFAKAFKERFGVSPLTYRNVKKTTLK